jgi:hypothetical protein
MNNNTENNIAYIPMYKSYITAVEGLNELDRLAIYEAIFNYGFTGEEPEFDNPYLQMGWQLVKPNLVNNITKMKSNQKNGKKGGRPKKQSTTSTKEVLNEGGKIKSNEVKTKSDNNIPQKKNNVLEEIKLTKQKQDDYSITIVDGEVVKLNKNDYLLVMGDEQLKEQIQQCNNQQGVEYRLKSYKSKIK